jgi:uncharacterized membrane protein
MVEKKCAHPGLCTVRLAQGSCCELELGDVDLTDFHIFSAGDMAAEETVVREIAIADVLDALRQGYKDFMEKPSHYIFVVLIYPIIGVAMFTWASGGNALQLIFPLITGFALLGPLAALGLYEISRRREQNLDTSWKHALNVRKSPAIPAIVAVGILLAGLFVVWLFIAQALFAWLYGADMPPTIIGFVTDVLSTQRGWTLIIMGNGIGFVFALVVLCTTVIAFPLLLDRDVGANTAVTTSIRAFRTNPVPMLAWGVIVAGCLFLGALPGLAGLVFVLPVLGHATWHIYRKVVVAPGSASAA